MAYQKQKRKRAARQNSNVFSIFDQKQIAEFKEAFSMFDHDADGFVDKEDLKDMLHSLGQAPTEQYVESMVNEAAGPINFTMFLTLMAEKLSSTDPEQDIRMAFECFDDDGSGLINVNELREAMASLGDRMTEAEVG
ncbi:Myosin regulatory light polypeptide 9 [Dispira simplex]|nr:Myosin regulatory light polypeptide 9 [Dispira simplex]